MSVANVRVMNYDLFTKKDCNARIAMIPDFHDASDERIQVVLEELNRLKPNAIVIQGDIMQAKKYLLNSDSQRRLKKVLRDASDICEIFLGLGNHDLCGMNKILLQGYRDLGKKNPKVHALCNGYRDLKEFNIRFTELHTSHITYAPSRQNSGNALMLFNNESKKLKKLEPYIDDDCLNILIYHNPKIIALAISIATQMKFFQDHNMLAELAELSRILSRFDGILAAHLHDGYYSITKLVNYILDHPEKALDYGLWEMPKQYNTEGKFQFNKINPLVYEWTNMCRGGQYISSNMNVEDRIIEMPREDLSKTPQYFRAKDLITHERSDYEEIDLQEAGKAILAPDRTPIYIAGAVNPFFNLDCGVPIITMLHIHGNGELNFDKKPDSHVCELEESNNYVKQKKIA